MTTLLYLNKTVALKKPIYGDTEGLEQTRINRRTRNNELKIFRDPIWPVSRTLKFSYDNLKEIDKNNLTNFIKETLGLDVGLIDYKGREWIGTLTSTSPEFSQSNDNCNIYTVDLEFEGIIQGETSGFTVGFTIGFRA